MVSLQALLGKKKKKGGLETTSVRGPPNSTATPNETFNGCQILFQGASPIVADIVFVHGLRGHPTNTWSKDNICWPRDLLSNEKVLSHVRVLTFGYDADVGNFVNPVSQNSIFDHSRSLINELARVRQGDLESIPIIFIAHSLGGLVVKDALDLSDRLGSAQPLFEPILKSTRGIIFLGTPHRGSDKASWGNIVTSIATIALRETNKSLIHDLERNSQTLDRIGTNFSLLLSKRTFNIFTFTEELSMSGVKGVGKVVENDSAVINDAHEVRNSIHANHVDMVKFTGTNDPGYQSVLFAIKTLVEGKLQRKSESKPTIAANQTRIFDNIPRRRIPHFVQRKLILNRLYESFERTTEMAMPLVTVLYGMGGAGKTQLALQYCLNIKKSGKIRGMFWIDASSRDAVYRGMEIIAKMLFPERELENADATVRLFRDKLSEWDEEWLIVFDNLDNPSELKDISSFFPSGGCGSILITSRHRSAKDLGRPIEVDRMEDDEGLKLLLGSSVVDEQRPIGREILKLLGYLPLAIDQARAYIRRRELQLTEFVEEYEVRKKTILQETPTLWHYHQDGDTERPLSVSTTWEMSLSLLGADGDDREKLRDVLTLFAFFHPIAISEEIFSNVEKGLHTKASPMSIFMDKTERRRIWNHFKFETAITEMQELSLLQFSRGREHMTVVSLHSMVSDWLRMRLNEESKLEFLGIAVLHLKNHLGSEGDKDFIWREEALSHLNAMRHTEEFSKNKDNFHRTFGSYYIKCGMYGDAEGMLQGALQNYETKFGPDHASTLATLDSLGTLYREQDRLEEAEKMHERALAGMKKTLGPNHTSTLNSVHNLGILYRKQGRLTEAVKMLEHAVAGTEEALGSHHTSTLRSIETLGNLYRKQGRLEEAEKLHERALAGKEKTLGPNHTLTLISFNNLGNVYLKQGRLEEAEKMYERALAGKEKTLGRNHTSTLMSARNLETIYQKQGRLEEAEKMHERALPERGRPTL